VIVLGAVGRGVGSEVPLAVVVEKYRPDKIYVLTTTKSTHRLGDFHAYVDHMTENAEIKGSARSIPGLHIRDILDEVATANPQLLEKFGGHAMAAGLSLKKSDFQAFIDAITTVVENQADEDTFNEIQHSDGELQAEDFDLKCADDLRYAAPWGQHFPPPLFDNNFVIVQKRLLKEKHYKLVLRPVLDAENPARTVDAIAFNVDIESWPEEGGEVHLLYRLEVNEFRDACTLQLMVERLLV